MKTAIITISNDPDVENPCENDQFKIYSFCTRHSNFTHPSELNLGALDSSGQPTISNIGLRRKLEAGTAFILSYYEHGLGCWSLQGEGNNCQWDSTRIAGLMVWEGKATDIGKNRNDRAKAARSFLEVYNDWCNGNTYAYDIKEYDEENDEEGEDISSCCGYIGDKHLLDGILDAIDGTDIKIVRADGECAFAIEELPLTAKKKTEGVPA